MTFNAAAQKEIDKLYKGRHHVALSIGILQSGETEFLRLGPDGKEVGGPQLVYPVGSICKTCTTSLLPKYLAAATLDLHTPIDR